MPASAPPAALSAQISSQLDAYIAAFNAGDFATAASHYDEPAVSISAASGVTVLPQRKDLAAFLAATVVRLRANDGGFSHSVWGPGPKTLLVLDDAATGAPHLLLASCTCRRLRGDGSACEEFAATYTLRDTGGTGGWRIVAIHQHALEMQLRPQ